jgi:hypothetical protein
VYDAVAAALQRAEGLIDGQPPTLLLEAITAEKLTLRAEVWAGDTRAAAPQLAWTIRAALPRADITVVE